MKLAATATKRMTAEEFFDWVHRPENENKDWELHRGEVVEVSDLRSTRDVNSRRV